MKKQMKYQIRRLVAAIIILAVFMIFTMSVMVKGIDNNQRYQDEVITSHTEVWK